MFDKRIRYTNGKEVSSEKINTWSLSHRIRLAPQMEDNYFWYVFEKKPLFGNIYKKLADQVVSVIEVHGEKWWDDEKNVDPLSII